jgi:ankyrin repeat protein
MHRAGIAQNPNRKHLCQNNETFHDCAQKQTSARQIEGGIMPTRGNLSAAEKYQHHHTKLMRAALEGQTDTIQALLDQGEDVNAKDDEGRTALMFATVNQHTETVKTLLEHGADVNARANDGGTALLLAASNGSLEIVQALLAKGADIRAEFAKTGKTALTLAEEHGHTVVMELLKT